MSQGISAAVLVDLTECHESVEHGKLVQEAERLSFPMHLLRLTLSGYRLTRHRASREFVAGCAAATSELKLLMMRMVVGVIGRHTKANMEFYSDDITMEGHEQHRSPVVEVVGDAVLDLVQSFKEDLQLDISLNKSAVVASCTVASKPLVRYLGMPDGHCYQMRNLGIDYAASWQTEPRFGLQVVCPVCAVGPTAQDTTRRS